MNMRSPTGQLLSQQLDGVIKTINNVLDILESPIEPEALKSAGDLCIQEIHNFRLKLQAFDSTKDCQGENYEEFSKACGSLFAVIKIEIGYKKSSEDITYPLIKSALNTIKSQLPILVAKVQTPYEREFWNDSVRMISEDQPASQQAPPSIGLFSGRKGSY